MRIDRVRATSFRCYAELDCAFAPGLTAVVGPNGAGKTSLIEAAHFGCLGWTPRTSDDVRVVADGAALTRVTIDVQDSRGPADVAVGFQPQMPKRITVDGVRQPSADRLAERFVVLVFTPDRLALVKGAPALRRAYLDRAVARLWPRFGQTAAEYARVLSQRNHLLRRIRAGQSSRESLAAWDAQVAQHGAEVAAARLRLVERLAPTFGEQLEAIGATAPSSLEYRPYGPVDAEGIARELERRQARDIERATTGAGPHRDDLALAASGRDVRAFGSQGEQRTALLALLLAEADLIREVREETPVLLLDDVASELDGDRRRRLLEAVAARGQGVLTTTDAGPLAGYVEAVIAVEAGQVRPSTATAA
jgi:DNA replication and repair protein RecF